MFQIWNKLNQTSKQKQNQKDTTTTPPAKRTKKPKNLENSVTNPCLKRKDKKIAIYYFNKWKTLEIKEPTQFLVILMFFSSETAFNSWYIIPLKKSGIAEAGSNY